MKLLTTMFLGLVLFSYIFGDEEVGKIDEIIVSTEHLLENQRELKREMINFENQKNLFMSGEQTIAHATTMVKTATHILALIRENHLDHVFSSEYLEELALFTSIGAKKSPARP